MTNNIDDIETLITRVLAEEATSEDRQRLDQWAKDPANAAYYEQAKRAFVLAEKHIATGKQVPLINVDEEWRRFLDRTSHKEDNVRELRSTRSTWIRIAATVLLIAVAGFVVNLVVSQDAETSFTTANETQRIELPDGSVVTLNRNSTLAYDEDFNTDQRLVRLDGEAFFDVTPDKSKPFVISSGDTRVEVVGTSFNVSAYGNEPQLTVTVETGVVRFSAASSAQSVELNPGQVGTYSKKEGVLLSARNYDANYNSWSTRRIEFLAASLQEVVKTLNKTYGSNITISGTVPDTCVVSVTFVKQSLDSVLRVLEATLNLTYHVDGDSIEITSTGC